LIRRAPAQAAATSRRPDETARVGIPASASRPADLNGTPLLVGEIQVNPAVMFGDADTDRPFGHQIARALQAGPASI
jgi:hypothetical protein